MKTKRMLQIFVVLVLMLGTLGNGQPALAVAPSSLPPDAMVIDRNLNLWDATYIGFVSSGIFERWHLELTEAENFEVSISTVTGDLVPFITLLDANGNELASGIGAVASSQPAGTYYIQVQPYSGSGFYFLKLAQLIAVVPTVTTTASPTSLNVGETAVVTVALSNVPTEGYTSAEFTCTYDAALLEASNIMAGSLFGADSAVAINGPQNGTFIVAIAGSNGNKATTDGTVFTFNVTGLQAGQAAVDCRARVSKGDNALTGIEFTGTSVTVVGNPPTPTPSSTPEPTFTSTPEGSATSTPVESPTPTFTTTPDGSATSTPVESPTPTTTSTPIASATPEFTATPVVTATPLPDGTVTGKVIAGKTATVGLYDQGGTLVTSVAANADGSFLLTAPAGTYTLVAVASGFLSAQGPVTLIGGSTITQATVALPAGDIDNNNVIDQFDAMTIGMSYNTSTPPAADLNNDGTINVLDLELLAQNYRMTGPVAWQ